MSSSRNLSAGLEDVEETDETIFMKACFDGNSECVEEFLVSERVSIPALSTALESSPLYVAVSNYYSEEAGHKRVVELLLRHGADPLITNSRGTTLAEIIIRDKEDLVDLLLEYLPDIEQPINKFGHTPLHVAIKMGTEGAVRKVLENDADLEIRFTLDSLPILHDAVFHERGDLLDVLLEFGADINDQSLNGYSPLHYVSSGAMVHELVARGADVDIRNRWGVTALGAYVSVAIPKRHEIIAALLECGADYKIANKEGVTPFSYLQDKIKWGREMKTSASISELFVQHVREKIPAEVNDYETRWIRDFGKEYDAARIMKMGNTTITYWEFITSSERKVARYTRNPNVAHAIQTYPFKYFTYALMNKYSEALEMRISEDTSRRLLDECFKNRLSFDALDRIIKLLSKEDLQKMQKWWFSTRMTPDNVILRQIMRIAQKERESLSINPSADVL